MKFQNLLYGRMHGRTSRSHFGCHFFKVGDIIKGSSSSNTVCFLDSFSLKCDDNYQRGKRC